MSELTVKMERVSEPEPTTVSGSAARTDPGLILIWLGGLCAGGLVHTNNADLRLVHPTLLLGPCLWLMWPARHRAVVQLQAVVFLYCIWLLVSSLFEVVWRVSGLEESSIYISSTLPVMLLVAVGWCFHRRHCEKLAGTSSFAGKALVAAVCVLAAHMAVLLGLIHSAYGFGCEEDTAVLGRMGLCALVLVGMTPVASSFRLRATLSLMIALVLLGGRVS